jgi:hypothetical protein
MMEGILLGFVGVCICLELYCGLWVVLKSIATRWEDCVHLIEVFVCLCCATSVRMWYWGGGLYFLCMSFVVTLSVAFTSTSNCSCRDALIQTQVILTPDPLRAAPSLCFVACCTSGTAYPLPLLNTTS